MKALVTVKRVIDPYVKIRVKSDQTGVESKNVKMTMNPFDEIALEEALRLREKGIISEVVLLSIGTLISQETLRYGLAMGADRAILVETEAHFPSLNIAKIIKHMVFEEEPQLVLMGKQAIDGDNNQTPQMLAALLGWPAATFVSRIHIQEKDIEVTREVDGGLERLKLSMPAVVSVDLRLNEPRYASLPNIMKAKQKSLQVIALADLPISLNIHQEILSVKAPDIRTGGIRVDSVESLLQKLKQEVKVI